MLPCTCRFGVLLSGGLDSSLIAAFARTILGPDHELHTFTIGLEDARDFKFAREVADHIGSIHHEFHYTVQQGIDMIPEVISKIETPHTTTVRSSIPNYLLGKSISSLGIKMVLSGEGSDEAWAGYLYFHYAPNNQVYTWFLHAADMPLPPSSVVKTLEGQVVLADKIGPVEERFTVNEVVERSGWGPYQQKMLLVTGIISFATAAEVWLVGIILKNIKCEWDLSSSQESLVTAILFIFYSIGSLTCGYFADKYGRWWVLVITIFITGISGVACAFAPSYYFFLMCRSFAGFAMGGNYAICMVYSQEMMSAAQRAKTMFVMEAFVVGGFLYTCLVALVVMDMDNGWRIQAFITAMPLVLAVVLGLFFLDESLRFLVINGKVKEARKIVDKIYKENDLSPPKGSLTVIMERKGELSDVWAAPHTFEYIQLTIHWICFNYVFFGVFLLGLNMLSDDYCGMVSWFNTTMVDDTGCDVYTNAEYWCLAVIAVAVVPGNILSMLCDWIGRRPTYTGIIHAGLVSTIFMSICLSSWVTITALIACVVCYTAVAAISWVYTLELYATYTRATAIGVHNAIGKLGAALGTYLTTYLSDYGVEYALLSFVVVQSINSIAALFPKRETKGAVLQDARSKAPLRGFYELEKQETETVSYGTID
eukprot:sb/3462851/